MGDTGGTWRLGRRPALDGLRGIAILLVLASHSTNGQLAAFGSAGVTIFFVLSGFLITALLLEERAGTGSITVRRFYARRVRRLAPALVVSTLAFTAVGFALGQGVQVWPSAAAVLLYVANWVVARGGSLGAFTTTWSLAVEEQFYTVWPLVLVVARRSSRVLVVAVALAGASVVARVVILSADGGTAGLTRVYGGTDTVAFALLAGAVLAVCRTRGGPGVSSGFGVCVGLLVTVAMCAAGGLYGFIVAGFFVVTLATAWVVWSVTGSGGTPALERAWLGWLGSRSYGIYLWHGPLLWAMRDVYRLGWPWLVGVGVPVSLLLAEVSYRWVEAPFRARRNAPRPAGAERGAERLADVSEARGGGPSGTR